MKVTYDEEVDVLTIEFSDAQVEESDQDKPGIILDYDKDGNIVGMEILNASNGCRIRNPSNTRLLSCLSKWVRSASTSSMTSRRALSVGDYSKGRRLLFPRLKPSTETISLRLPKSLLDQLKTLANKRDVPYQTLLKLFVLERVQAELRPRPALAS